MSQYYEDALLEDWKCAKCGTNLKPAKVDIAYMGSQFTIELPKCEICGLILIPESLATGRMAEVEKILEDK
jgi:hypothetical protein